MGEEDEERYEVLRDLCLTHRDILPFAQEELFKRLDIDSDETMDMLNRSIASSDRCMEYASRTESIRLDWGFNLDNLMESGAFNPRELSSEATIKSSTLSKSCLNHATSPALTLISSTDRFQNLRRIDLWKAQLDEALALPNLETFSSVLSSSTSIDAKAAFSSVNLPNLRRLMIFTRPGSIGKYFDSIIPQLDHLTLSRVDKTDLERFLLLPTSLQSISCKYDSSVEGLTGVLAQIMRIDVKEFHFSWSIVRESSDNWETVFEAIAKFKKVMGGKDELKRVTLELSLDYSRRPSSDVCNRALLRWKGIKDELNSIGVKNGIEVATVSCSFSVAGTTVWEE
jgi:hypothetical protein